MRRTRRRRRHRRRPAGAPAIVFVHGTRLTGAMWAAQQAELADEFRTIAIDLPAHGARAGEPFTLDGAADVLSAARSATTRPVAGPSSSACRSVGTSRWRSPPANPDRSAGWSCPARPPSRSGSGRCRTWPSPGVMDRVEDERLDRLNARFFRARYPPEIAEPIVAGGFWSEGGAQALRALVGERFVPRLAAYPGPTLILNGEFDVLFRLSAPAFAAAAVDARRVLLAGATHLANLDRPLAFSEGRPPLRPLAAERLTAR